MESQIIDIISNICHQHNITENITSDFCPGMYIMSQVLVSIIPEIEIRTGLTVPIDCYIFHDSNKSKEQLSIKDAVNKLLKVATYEQ